MLPRARRIRDRLLSTLWFLPAVIVAGSVVLAVLLVELSARVDAEVLSRWPRLFGASADSARGMLAAIAGSMITVAGVTFSITIVAVTQASAQYTPRVLRTFMRDRPSQVVLGGLVGVFTYCLVVLRTIRGGEDYSFVPSIAVLVGFVLAAVGIALLIYFIHHIATALQATSLITRVSADTIVAVNRLFPAEVGEPADPRAAEDLTHLERLDWHTVESPRTGYVQHVDTDALIAVARRQLAVVRMERGVGDFVIEGMPLASLAARTRDDGSSLDRAARHAAHTALATAYTIGVHRTVEQDAAFGVRQLADIALKALSPGINDPTTAATCVDHLGAVLVRAATRAEEPEVREDDGVVRVLACGPTFVRLLDEGMGEVRRYAEGHVLVLNRLLGVLDTLGAVTREPARRAALVRHLVLLEEAITRSVRAPADREGLLAQGQAVRSRLADGVATARRQVMGWMLALLLAIPTQAARAQPPVDPPTDAPSGAQVALPDTATLVFHNRRLVVFRSAIGAMTARERALAAVRRLEALATADALASDSVHARTQAAGSLVVVGDRPVFLVTDADVDTLGGETREEVVAAAVSRTREALAAVREEGSVPHLLRATGLAMLSTALFLLALRAIGWSRHRVRRRLPLTAGRHVPDLAVGGFTILSARQAIVLLRRIAELAFLAAGLFFAYAWVVFVLTRFGYTRPWGEALGAYLASTVRTLVLSAAAGVPGLFTVVLIVIATRWLARLVGAFFDAVEAGTVGVGWVHPDTAHPTKRIAMAMLWLFAIVVAYPYLPGSGSDVFKGVTVFAGLVISLGSSGLVNQAMSGLVLMYSRALKPGEYVRVGDVEGTVTTLGMLSTKIRTTKQEEVTIPNTVVVGTNVKNFTRLCAPDGIVLHTPVTIGYDVPWRQVEGLLLLAASRTPALRTEPPPFVQITALSDFYVEYLLNAYLDAPERRTWVLSALHARIVDAFNEHGVQIMSPHYETDPPAPVVVPRERWHAPPAAPPEVPPATAAPPAPPSP